MVGNRQLPGEFGGGGNPQGSRRAEFSRRLELLDAMDIPERVKDREIERLLAEFADPEIKEGGRIRIPFLRVIVPPGNVGVIIEGGRPRPYVSGPGSYNAFPGAKVALFNTEMRVARREINTVSRENLQVKIEFNIAYSVNPRYAYKMFEVGGADYCESVLSFGLTEMVKRIAYSKRSEEMLDPNFAKVLSDLLAQDFSELGLNVRLSSYNVTVNKAIQEALEKMAVVEYEADLERARARLDATKQLIGKDVTKTLAAADATLQKDVKQLTTGTTVFTEEQDRLLERARAEGGSALRIFSATRNQAAVIAENDAATIIEEAAEKAAGRLEQVQKEVTVDTRIVGAEQEERGIHAEEDAETRTLEVRENAGAERSRIKADAEVRRLEVDKGLIAERAEHKVDTTTKISAADTDVSKLLEKGRAAVEGAKKEADADIKKIGITTTLEVEKAELGATHETDKLGLQNQLNLTDLERKLAEQRGSTAKVKRGIERDIAKADAAHAADLREIEAGAAVRIETNRTKETGEAEVHVEKERRQIGSVLKGTAEALLKGLGNRFGGKQ